MHIYLYDVDRKAIRFEFLRKKRYNYIRSTNYTLIENDD